MRFRTFSVRIRTPTSYTENSLFFLDDACRIDMHNPPNLEGCYQEDEQCHTEEDEQRPIKMIHKIELGSHHHNKYRFGKQIKQNEYNQISKDIHPSEHPGNDLRCSTVYFADGYFLLPAYRIHRNGGIDAESYDQYTDESHYQNAIMNGVLYAFVCISLVCKETDVQRKCFGYILPATNSRGLVISVSALTPM